MAAGVSPRIGAGWRDQADALNNDDATVTVVEGSLATLIPHEPVISGAELVLRVKAMAGTVQAEETEQLAAARAEMNAFASAAACGEAGAEEDTQAASILWLPAALSELERSVLHGEAEERSLVVAHEPRGGARTAVPLRAWLARRGHR